jgi:hypothetical protein
MAPRAKLLLVLGTGAALLSTAASAQLATEGGKRYVVRLTGATECNNTGTCNLGDPDGIGRAVIVVNRQQKRVCWEIHAERIEAITAAHIHLGFAGQAFPNNIIVHLSPSSGCTTTTAPGGSPIPENVLAALINAPQAFYVNVHNAPFPPGALRGQLGS